MWTNTIDVKFKGNTVRVLLWLSDTDENCWEVVSIRNEDCSQVCYGF